MEQNEERMERFKDDVADLGVGGPSMLSERSLLVIGVVLVVIGIALVFGGWWGASGEGTVAAQFPYLLSGGVLGLACVIAGSVLFARYSMARFLRLWLIRLVYEQQTQTDRIVDALQDRDRRS